MSDLKEYLYNYCLKHIERNIETLQQAIFNAQESSRNETKSSAGDKYETGRAMAQQEIERNTFQLKEAQRQKTTLEKIHSRKSTDYAGAGNLVLTDQGNFYIATGAGQITYESEIYYAVSAASPVAVKLNGLSEGQQFDFNDKKFAIIKIL